MPVYLSNQELCLVHGGIGARGPRLGLCFYFFFFNAKCARLSFSPQRLQLKEENKRRLRLGQHNVSQTQTHSNQHKRQAQTPSLFDGTVPMAVRCDHLVLVLVRERGRLAVCLVI
jgi:hypothetical protein